MMNRTPYLAVLVAICALGESAAAQIRACPPVSTSEVVTFPGGELLMRTPLAVNPDGALASYTPGDHGYTYINNGVNLMVAGAQVSCAGKSHGSRCHRDWETTEAGNFGPGTPEFCVFAMEVEPWRPNDRLVPCPKSEKGRFLVGNGKGRPKSGPTVPGFNGEAAPTYVSTTSLQHTRDGTPSYVDSSAIPGLVVPKWRKDLVGAIAWVKFGEHQGFAIVNDTGPRFGEGTVALHQLLRRGQIGPAQRIGPIPLAERCAGEELQLKPPFVSRPKEDRCRPGYRPKGPADIRAYSGIDKSEVTTILTKIKPPMSGRRITEELTVDRLAFYATSAGYTLQKLEKMARCLP